MMIYKEKTRSLKILERVFVLSDYQTALLEDTIQMAPTFDVIRRI